MAKCGGIVDVRRFIKMGGDTGRDFFVLCIASLLTPFRMRSKGPYWDGVGTNSSHSRVLWTVRTALTYCAKLPRVLTRPVEISHVAKKHKTQGAIGRNSMLANTQKSLNTFHSEDSA